MQIEGYCQECRRPMTYVYKVCVSCKRKCVTTGFEPRRVKLGEVGRAMINHQQSLHTKFFGCNAPVNYRGLRKDRIYYNIDNNIIYKYNNIINKYIYNMNNKHGYLYRNIPNISLRILYNATLFYLNYLSKESLFNSHLHLKASLNMMVLIMIENTYLRTNHKSREDLRYIYQERQRYNTKTHDDLYKCIEECCQGVIGELVRK